MYYLINCTCLKIVDPKEIVVVLSIPGAAHILAQPLKRCSVSRTKLNETSELAKKRHNIFCFGVCGCVGVRVCGRKNFFTLSPSYMQSPKNREKCLCLTVLELRWVISTWWDENMTLFVFSVCYEIHWDWFCGRKQTKNAKIRRGVFFREGCFARKEYISNTANKGCSRQVLQLRCSSSYSIKFDTQR